MTSASEKFDTAREIAENISDPLLRFGALRQVAKDQSQSGFVEESEKTSAVAAKAAMAVEPGIMRTGAFLDLATWQIQAGQLGAKENLDRASEAAEAIDASEIRAALESKIGAAFAKLTS